ncbi:cysteine-rich DPF motif domain-containing protein 1-like [Physella acuta]|uniref:cysteine-rich DPF motif domain-containing protein 1-like n=1 Tax=Physella acuta TaxID=109671 RepID=UPI0027DE1050|nr:cysteine-rich DPF motif domain-containing protein 1-like [Physella acuta]
MASNNKENTKSLKSFVCSLCDISFDYHYKGRKPPFAKCILLLEDCFVLKDPFSTSGGFINVGGMCSLCGKNVCLSNECSLFYVQRFCLNCAHINLQEFPMELQREITEKMKAKDNG